MKKQIELLAPAGSREALHAAVENGADAVYLGGKLFNARQQADNFDIDVLREELKYSHARGVSIYLTMNTLISDCEMKQALEFAVQARRAGIDGIIVQDIGLAAALRHIMPDMPLHASTQMTVYDIAGVRALEEMGLKRVVLARELTLEEVSEIARHTSLEVEVFIHGALCVCYSGQCLMSSMIGGRSGNRGKCAQPCRLPYQLVGPCRDSTQNARYLLSPKDICSLDFIGDILSSGISFLKIEGRMKSPEYVATVVRIYRKYINLAQERINRGDAVQPEIEEADRHDLLQIFNRGGFSEGYMKGKTGADMMSFEKPNNSGIYLGKAQAYDNRSHMISIRLEDSLSVGDGVEVWAGRSDSPGGIITSVRKGKNEVKSAGKGELVQIGPIRGRIAAADRVYKTTDVELNRIARESFSGKNTRRIEITGQVSLRYGKPLLLNVKDNSGHSAEAEGTVPAEKAVNRPLMPERLEEQLRKTGATPFVFEKLEIDIEGGLSIPVSEINEVRRQALDRLLETRAGRYAGVHSDVGISKRLEEILSQPGRVMLQSEQILRQPEQILHQQSEQVLHQSKHGHLQSEQVLQQPEWVIQKSDPTERQGYTRREPVKSESPKISLYFYKWDRNKNLSGLGADRVYLPFAVLEKPGFGDVVSSLKTEGVQVFGWLPSITRGNYKELINRFLKKLNKSVETGNTIEDCNVGKTGSTAETGRTGKTGRTGEAGSSGVSADSCFDGILAGNIGTFVEFSKSGLRLAGDISMNLFNALSLRKASKFGPESAALSLEMTLQQIHELSSSLSSRPALEAAVYGRLPLMISEYCPVGCTAGGYKASSKCSGCCGEGEYMLKDRLGVEFPVLCDRIDCRSTVLNSTVLFVPDGVNSLRKAGIDIFRLYIFDERPEDIKELVRLFRAAAAGDSVETASHSDLVERIKAGGYTKGHYYRGV